ncbi:hypothetical protein M2323_004362 [Rhodoblastus acidophilus]|uniref:hypothetical protein n=1 Tax=Rhodoblastus acidophilus TaxID=1074 RepID=UPI0022253B85|nr:hypothetical protein [Rhodoblastus acidophilus]MCW2286565.1 hypothetical protein [Rhodoblastus acidophilus]MCW2335414.1 hypothetical protein [Rhodoblastus acidophilus]
MTDEADDKPATTAEAADRRAFLSALGRFSAVTPPAITLLLSTTLSSQAIAHSGGGPRRPGGHGWGSHHHDHDHYHHHDRD